jgi:uncharacterized protein
MHPHLTELFDQIKVKNTVSVTQLLQTFPELLQTTDANNMTPFLFSAYTGATEIIQSILAMNLPLSIWEYAVAGEVTKMKELLAQNQNLLNAYSPDGWTPLHLAAFFGKGAVLEELLQQGAMIDPPSHSPASPGNSPLQAAIARGQTEAVKVLLTHGADVNFVQEPAGLTPLHIAASRPAVEIVKMLLKKGARQDTTTHDGKRPIDFARERNQSAVVEFLSEKS